MNNVKQNNGFVAQAWSFVCNEGLPCLFLFSCYVMDYSLHMHCLMKTILTVLMPIIRCMLRVNPRLRITT